MTTPNPRLREALARLVLPQVDAPPPVTPESLRQRASELTALQPIYATLPHVAWVLEHIADQLDGPLASAWERSVESYGESLWHAMRTSVHTDDAVALGRMWPKADVRLQLRATALRALEEPVPDERP